jgi:hypothetical protein
MFPTYMQYILDRARCGHCNAPQTTADIAMVGVRRPEEFEAFYAEPVFVIVMGCKHCGQWTNNTIRRTRNDSVDGFVSFIQLIEAECAGKKPPLNIPGLGKKSQAAPCNPSSPDATNRPANALDKQRPRPSIRPNQPVTPPTQEEIQAFLRRLRATPFKRGSKGFATWMKKLGADMGPDGENNLR